MKVLHIISGDLWAGAEVQAFTLLTALQKQSIQVAAAVMNEGELTKRLRERQIPVSVFPENRLNPFQILFGLRALMEKWEPDVVHTHRLKENILGSIANKFSGNVPCLRTVHGSDEHSSTRFLSLHKRVLHRLDFWCGAHLQEKIVAVSRELANELAKALPPSKLVVIENGLDIDAVHQEVHGAEFVLREPDAKHVGIVGRLVPVKRVDLFLEIANLLSIRDPECEWRFHIFGDGPLAEALRTQASSLKIRNIITFHGHRSDIISCIGSLNALLICSDHEGLPMTALEALAIGTPIVAHAVGGLRSLLSNREAALLVEDQDAASYASSVLSLISRERQPASAQIHNIPTAASNAQQMETLYKQLANAI